MKKQLTIFAMFFFLIIINACKKDEIVVEDVLKVYGLTEQVNGKSYQDLDQAAIIWQLGTEISKGPLDDPTGSRSDEKLQPLNDVMILGTNLGGISTRSLTIPSGKPVFFQIGGAANWFFDVNKCDPDFKPTNGQTPEAFLATDIDPILNGVKNLSAQLDGKDLATDLKKYKVSTKAFKFVPAKDFTDPNCDFTNQKATAFDESYALLVKIPKGKHILTYKADFPDAGDFHTEITWNLTVE